MSIFQDVSEMIHELGNKVQQEYYDRLQRVILSPPVFAEFERSLMERARHTSGGHRGGYGRVEFMGVEVVGQQIFKVADGIVWEAGSHFGTCSLNKRVEIPRSYGRMYDESDPKEVLIPKPKRSIDIMERGLTFTERLEEI